jgi:hypothetical protein
VLPADELVTMCMLSGAHARPRTACEPAIDWVLPPVDATTNIRLLKRLRTAARNASHRPSGDHRTPPHSVRFAGADVRRVSPDPSRAIVIRSLAPCCTWKNARRPSTATSAPLLADAIGRAGPPSAEISHSVPAPPATPDGV